MSDLKPFNALVKELVDREIYETRSRATDAIKRGVVFVDGEKARKPSQKIAPEATITIDDPAHGYVSRAALKLDAALEAFSFDPFSRFCLDIGASTGGFSEVLLEAGAAQVFAVDVGHGQLHEKLRNDQRVIVHENLNIRDLKPQHIAINDDVTLDAIVCDVSFISLKLALPAALRFAAPGCWAALLVKPQFEVGKDGVGKGGIVEPALGRETAEDIAAWLEEQEGWSVKGLIECPIKGSDGNLEYMLGAVFDG